jgi:HEAT repeat protein
MARSLGLLLLSALAFAHGGSARSQPGQGGTQITIVPTGGSGRPDLGPAGGPTTESDRARRHTWEIWWSYHREHYLAQRTRGAVTTGVRELDDRKQRQDLREGRLIDLLLGALEDKDKDVRSSAAVALGKFGLSKGVRGALERRLRSPPEGWPDVREGSIYGTGLLALAENRRFLDTIARDKDRSAREQSMALTGLMMDGTGESADLLAWHARYFHSGVQSGPETPPARAEQERRRFATHLLGFVEGGGHDDFLWQVACGGRAWGVGEQSMAITALGRRRAEPFKGQIFRLLYERADRNLARSAAIALGMMIDHDDAEDLRRLARFVRDSRADTIAQNFAVMSLGQIGGETAVELLKELLRVFGDEEDRAFVYLALGLCGARSASARDTLLVEYRRADAEVEQGVLALACGIARVTDAVPLTVEALEKPRRRDTEGLGARGRFAGWAALGLGFHGDARGLPPVRKLLAGSNDPFVREQAAVAASMLLRSAAVGELMAILRDAGTLHAKAAVVVALGVLPEPTAAAVDALESVYRDDSTPNPVRALAVCALGALAEPRPVPVSALLVRNYNYFVRCLALDEIASYL